MPVYMRAILGASAFDGGASTTFNVVSGEWDPSIEGNITVDYPEGTVSGDGLFLFIGTAYDSRGISTPSGWTLHEVIAYANRHQALSRIAGGESSVTLSMATTDTLTLYAIVRVPGPLDATPVLLSYDSTSPNTTSDIDTAIGAATAGLRALVSFVYGDENVTSATIDADLEEHVNIRHSQSEGAIRQPGLVVGYEESTPASPVYTTALDANSYGSAVILYLDEA